MVRTTNGWRHQTQVLRFRRAVVLEAIKPCHQIAALPRSRTRRQCFVVGIGRLEPCSHAGGGFRSSGERGLRRSAHPTVHRLAQEGVSAKIAAHLDIRRTFGWRSPFFAGCTPRKGDSNSSVRFMLDLAGFRPLAWRTKGTREIRSRAEHRRTNSLQHGCFYSGLNSAPKLVPNSAKASSSGTDEMDPAPQPETAS
jgi:hypothetical protein